MTDEAVTKRILKFLRQMNSEETDDRLRRHAIDRQWIAPNGAPTPAGRDLIQAFDDLEEASSGYRR